MVENQRNVPVAEDIYVQNTHVLVCHELFQFLHSIGYLTIVLSDLFLHLTLP